MAANTTRPEKGNAAGQRLVAGHSVHSLLRILPRSAKKQKSRRQTQHGYWRKSRNDYKMCLLYVQFLRSQTSSAFASSQHLAQRVMNKGQSGVCDPTWTVTTTVAETIMAAPRLVPFHKHISGAREVRTRFGNSAPNSGDKAKMLGILCDFSFFLLRLQGEERRTHSGDESTKQRTLKNKTNAISLSHTNTQTRTRPASSPAPTDAR
ncbi:hypothetical protein F2P81_008227 [Scophthalmus maximus]|uniref:Uncharacterized protein n=1 Tax=Scophthalmus maximus TaxID=52904 RepID=A0A6A4TCR7_SCOMX|nr:hypothetical protein F2P81_008227 [Scophthalmus maximus]